MIHRTIIENLNGDLQSMFLEQWLSTGVPREILLNNENSIFGEVVEIVVVVKCVKNCDVK